jgi:hypothetical protein
MISSKTIHLPAKGLGSLSWDGEDLVDWVGGGARYSLTGEIRCRSVNYAYPFDAAVVSPSGEFAVLYTRLQTKGLILRRGEIVREINRSFYHADAYEYPIALLRAPNGREILAHCPNEYNQLELDDLASGERLTASKTRNPSDFFVSRLISPASGSYLLSAGWVWHPFDVIKAFNIAEALSDPTHLDGAAIPLESCGERSSACFRSDEAALIWIAEDTLCEDSELARLGEHAKFGIIQHVDLKTVRYLKTVVPQAEVGTMMAVGTDHVVGFHGHPKLFDLTSGSVVASWPETESGKQQSSILLTDGGPPPLALDPVNQRFAVAGKSGITVVQFESKRA